MTLNPHEKAIADILVGMCVRELRERPAVSGDQAFRNCLKIKETGNDKDSTRPKVGAR